MEGASFFFGWEITLMEWLQRNLGLFGEKLAVFFTLFGEELVTVLVIGFLYLCYDKRIGRRVALVVIVSNVWNPLVKNIALRRRPYFDHDGIRCLRPVDPNADIMDVVAQGYSLPSGHSQNAMTVFGMLAVTVRKKGLIALGVIVPLLVGISRVCLGVHFPTDVMAGWALGLLSISALGFLQKRLRKQWVLYLILLLTGLPGFFYCTTNDYYIFYGLMLGYFAGTLCEERFVCFRNTRKPLRAVLRVLGAGAIFLGMSKLIHVFFDTAFLDSATIAAYLARMVWMSVTIFAIVAVYPMLFHRLDWIFHEEA